MNSAETGQIIAFLESNGFEKTENPHDCDFLIINTCAVKQPTENKMLRRIKAFAEISKKSSPKIIVCGCLPKINPSKIFEVSKNVFLCGPSLLELSRVMQLPESDFSPKNPVSKSNEFISILPIAKGCLGNCSFCGTKIARGKLESFTVKELIGFFEKNFPQSKEFWLTAQDTGCYGKDIGTSLPDLLKKLLEHRGNFRIRVGMMSPNYLISFFEEFMELFEDERLYRFFHLPFQSGSGKILQLMKRPYSAEQCVKLVSSIRKRFPDAAIATDIIAGFPQETKQDFDETIRLLERIRPDIVNISRYGKRPNTVAAQMDGQVPEHVKKERSRILTRLCRKISFERNKKMAGFVQTIFVSEKGKGKTFVGRSGNYKAVVVSENFLGKFVKVKISKAMPTYLVGKALK